MWSARLGESLRLLSLGIDVWRSHIPEWKINRRMHFLSDQ